MGFSYPEAGRTTLQDISFGVEPGERIAWSGRSGSGKTTWSICWCVFMMCDRVKSAWMALRCVT
ncbi:MAG: hypothetical protein R3E89_14750 [Thiolinea sp.]